MNQEQGPVPSTIEWTDETWNPVTGCSRVSPGCDNCYMFALYPRLRAMAVPGYDTSPDHVRILRDRLDSPLRWKRPRQVFVNSMSDLFHPHVEYEFITEVFAVMKEASQHMFQVLTKRPGRAHGWWKSPWPARFWRVACECMDRHVSGKSEVRAQADRPGKDTSRHKVRVRRAIAWASRSDPVAE